MSQIHPASDKPAVHKISEGIPEAEFRVRELVESDELVLLNQKDPGASEKFRHLAAKLFHAKDRMLKVIEFTSPLPGEGKTSVAANTALAGALSGLRILLVDVDFRRPRLQSWIRPKPGIGLAEVLSGQADARHAVVRIKGSDLHILPAGKDCSRSLNALNSPRMQETMAGLREHYDRIILDTPPALPFADAATLANWVDGVVLVTRASATPEKALEQSIELIGKDRIIGLVVNGYQRSVLDGYDRYEGYYKYYRDSNIRGE